MKKFILTVAFALSGLASIYAAKAYPGAITITQSDGTQLTVYLHGDEHFSWCTAEDGALLVPVGKNYYIAQVESDGSLKATPQLAHNKELRNQLEKNAVSLQDKEAFNAGANNMIARSLNININKSVAYFPHIGSPKALVLLVQFPDCKFKTNDPKTVFNYFLNAKAGEAAPEALTQYYNGNNIGSVSEYFREMSQGTFTPIFDVQAPVTVSKNHSYYGQDSGSSKDIHYKEMIKEACELAKQQLGVKFSDYDANNDGKADLVYVIHAGMGQNDSNVPEDLWAKTNFSNVTTIDGIAINAHGINSELNPTPNKKTGDYISGIGVFCHEFSHTMGLPDMYPYNTNAYINNQEPEYWDLMDAGEYVGNGRRPAPYTAWEMDIMGWPSEIENLGKEEKQITMLPYDQSRKAYKIDAEDGQYLILQNVQNNGWWNGCVSHGLLIFRVDYKKNEVGTSSSMRMNQTPGSPDFTVLPADGIIINQYLAGDGKQYTAEEYLQSHYGDVFPGSQNVTELLEANLNNNVTLTNLLYNIKETADGNLTFDYLRDITNGIESPTIISADNQKIYSLDGLYLGTDTKSLNKGIYIIGNKKVVIK